MDTMEPRVLEETRYCTIVEGGLGAGVPYRSEDYGDGTRNAGYVDLKANPALIDSIPEVQGWPEFADLLRAINAPTSAFLSIGCEKGFFPVDQVSDVGIRWYVGSYMDITFADAERRRSPEAFLGLARTIAAAVDAGEGLWVRLELVVQRMRNFHGDKAALSLMVKICGHGRDQDEARLVWADCAGLVGDVLGGVA